MAPPNPLRATKIGEIIQEKIEIRKKLLSAEAKSLSLQIKKDEIEKEYSAALHDIDVLHLKLEDLQTDLDKMCGTKE